MERAYTTFVGIDLGGARGKTTAVAIIEAGREGREAVVLDVAPRAGLGTDEEPWTDDALIALIEGLENPCIAIDAPLTTPACIRCVVPACPGQIACSDVATVWLETSGAELVRGQADESRIAATSNATVGFTSEPMTAPPSGLFPYLHRCTEIELHYQRGLFPREKIGQSAGAVANRARHLARRLEALGYALNDALIEVEPRATVTALYGEELARGYKRDADPWQTRAQILEDLGVELRFAARSRLSREQCLANDNCFEALLSAFTAYLYARDGWTMPEGPFAIDGWIWAPPG